MEFKKEEEEREERSHFFVSSFINQLLKQTHPSSTPSTQERREEREEERERERGKGESPHFCFSLHCRLRQCMFQNFIIINRCNRTTLKSTRNPTFSNLSNNSICRKRNNHLFFDFSSVRCPHHKH